MKPDPIDELGARLFEVARRETPRAGAVERAILGARRTMTTPESTVSAWWLALIPLAAGIAAVTVGLALPGEPLGPLSAEPAAALPPAKERPEMSPAVVTRVPPPVVSAPPAVKSPPVSSAPMTLADELDALKRAQRALDTGDARRALEVLDRYDRNAKGQRMRAEATLLRIDALARSGREGDAAALARRFVDENPESPLVDRARSFVARDPAAAGGQPQNEAAGGQPQNEAAGGQSQKEE